MYLMVWIATQCDIRFVEKGLKRGLSRNGWDMPCKSMTHLRGLWLTIIKTMSWVDNNNKKVIGRVDTNNKIINGDNYTNGFLAEHIPNLFTLAWIHNCTLFSLICWVGVHETLII